MGDRGFDWVEWSRRNRAALDAMRAAAESPAVRAAREVHEQALGMSSAVADAQRAIARFVGERSAVSDAIAALQAAAIQRFEFPELAEFGRWIVEAVPPNLRSADTDITTVAAVSLEDGIPLAWIPHEELVQELTTLGESEERFELLLERRSDVLDDCVEALRPIDHAWARAAEEAVVALAAGHPAPAQSHAANLIDSIVLTVAGQGGRKIVQERAQDDLGEVLLVNLSEALTLRPLARVFVTWYPGSDTPPPDHFARNLAAHGVGIPGVFTDRHALVAVMLASSLAVEFGRTDS